MRNTTEITYYPRVVDREIERKLNIFTAINIVGPKWCGKTMAALQKAKSSLMLQKDPNKQNIILTAQINPDILLDGDKPRLIDEWQDAPNIWDAVRSRCDFTSTPGQYILTGSTSKKVKTQHTGTGRISTINMYPMSLFESKESNGQVSLKKLFDGEEKLEKGCVSDLSLEQTIFSACRGGWPYFSVVQNKEDQLELAKDYYYQIFTRDIFNVDGIIRDHDTMEAILKSYARNISTLAKKVNILQDVQAIKNISEKTLDDYIEVLEKLYIIQDLNGWCPNIRSKTAMRNGRKREFVDPSIACAALGGSPTKYMKDLKSFGFIFETLCIRDLRVYSSALKGKLSYYRDNLGLECDCVLHLDDTRYALIEFKLGDFQVEDGSRHLNKLESLIKEHNLSSPDKIDEPTLKIIVTASKYGYRRPDGVFVIPIGCLKD